MEEGLLACLQACPGRGGDGGTVELGQHLDVAESEPFSERRRIGNAVGRRGYDRDAEILEERRTGIEVNQLLTAERSPMSSVEKYDAPRACRDVG